MSSKASSEGLIMSACTLVQGLKFCLYSAPT